jgi:hypothetical protein
MCYRRGVSEYAFFIIIFDFSHRSTWIPCSLARNHEWHWRLFRALLAISTTGQPCSRNPGIVQACEHHRVLPPPLLLCAAKAGRKSWTIEWSL